MKKERALQIIEDAMTLYLDTCADSERSEIQEALNYIDINLK